MPVSQITFQTQKDTVKEGSQLVLVANFRDRDTAEGVIPDNVFYRIDCLTSGAVILGWTEIGPDEIVEEEETLPQSTITITADQNAIQRNSNTKERRQVTVATDYGLATAWRESFEYDVVNLRGTP